MSSPTPAPKTIHKTIQLHPAQSEFRRSPALYRGFVGGRGAGKTYIGAYDLICRAKKKRTYMIVSPTYGVLYDTTLPTFKARAEELGAWGKFRATPHPTADLATGATVRFRSAEFPDRMRGPNLSGVWLDEASLMDAEAYTIAIGALREGGEQGWLSATFTPKGLEHWTYERFATQQPDTAIFHAATATNPFLPPDFAATLAKQYRSDFARQELGGEFFNMEGGFFRGLEAVPIIGEAPVASAFTRRVRAWDLACLTSGTLIETDGGRVPIEDIRAGDRVRTRAGYRRVKWAGPTKAVDEITTVQFANGAAVSGTADHRVWTENRGWVPLGSLEVSDLCTTTRGDSWGSLALTSPIQKWCSSTASPTRAGPARNITRRGDGIASQNAGGQIPCIGRSGVITTGRFPRDTTFTIRTGITTTTLSTTWNRLPGASTPNCTTGSETSTERNGRRSIIGELCNSSGRTPSIRNASARSAATNSSLGGLTCLLSTVGRSARHKPVRNRGPNGSVVYDLQVDGDPEFFANGILVHNSTEAQSGTDPDWTVGVLLARHQDGTYWVLDIVRERIGPAAVRALIRQTAALDGVGVPIRLEREGGSAGKLAADSIIREDLGGYAAYAVKPKGSKAERAEPWAASIEAGNVRLVKATWNAAFLAEHRAFPSGSHDDIIDGCSLGHADVSRGSVAAGMFYM